jgi:hypothetical protein
MASPIKPIGNGIWMKLKPKLKMPRYQENVMKTNTQLPPISGNIIT